MSATKTIQYRYDARGNRSALIDADGGRFSYAYDSVGRISHLENPQNERTSYAYDAASRRTLKQLANGTRASFTYDAANRLTRLANLKSDIMMAGVSTRRYEDVLPGDGSDGGRQQEPGVTRVHRVG